jgi:hypothetical protein
MPKYRDQSDENHMVLPVADDEAVMCTCHDFEAGDCDPHCRVHVDYDIREIEADFDKAFRHEED